MRLSKLGTTDTSTTTFDRIEMWVNPASNANLTAPTGNARLQLADGTGLASLTYLIVRQAALDADDRVRFDRVMVGTSWDDVVPLSPDTNAPVVTISTPTNGTPYAPGIKVNVSATATDDRAVSQVQLLVDGALTASNSSAPYQFVVTNLALGAHTLLVRALDPSGNVGSNAVNITVTSSTGDTTPPTVTITAPANNASFATGASVLLSATVTDGVGIVQVEALVDGVSRGSLAYPPYNFSVTNLAVGPHVLAVRALDTSGNLGSNSVTVVITNIPAPIGNIIYTEWTDQILKQDRSNGVVTFGGEAELGMIIGGTGSGAGFDRCGVTVFKLPDFGAVANPFTTASFGIYHTTENVSAWNGDLYGLGARASSAVALTDYWGNTNVLDTTDAVLLQNNFLVATGLATNTLLTTSATGSNALRDYLNAQYAGGAGIGKYVFLRINTDAVTAGATRYNLFSADAAAGNLAQTPQIAFTVAAAPTTRFEACLALPGFFSGMNLFMTNAGSKPFFVWSSPSVGASVTNWTIEGPMVETPLNDGTGNSRYALNVNPALSPVYYVISTNNLPAYANVPVPVHWITTDINSEYTFYATNTTITTNGMLGLNVAPVAAADSATMPEDSTANIEVLVNDTDINPNTTLSLVSVSASSGVASIAGTNVVFTPATNFFGTNLLTYVITDGTLTATGQVVVTVTAVNDAPLAVNDNATTVAGQPVTIHVLANDTDVEGDALSLVSVTSVNGTCGIVGTNVLYTPAPGYAGMNVFNYVISDGSLTATGQVTVAVLVTPVLAGVAENPDHTIAINVSVHAGQSYRVLAATNLVPPVVWQPVLTNVSAGTNLTLHTITNPPGMKQRFYQLISP